MTREGNVKYQGRSKSGLLFKHDNTVLLSKNFEIARIGVQRYSTIVDASIGYLSISQQPWPKALDNDPLKLLQGHIDNDIPLSAVTLPRPDNTITTLDISAPVIMLSSMYSEAQHFKLSGGQHTEVKDQGIVYGDNLVKLLRWMLDVLQTHTHPPNSPPTTPVPVFADKISGELAVRKKQMDTVGSEFNILNYFVRSK